MRSSASQKNVRWALSLAAAGAALVGWFILDVHLRGLFAD